MLFFELLLRFFIYFVYICSILLLYLGVFLNINDSFAHLLNLF